MFSKVIEYYSEVKAVHETNSCAGFYARLSGRVGPTSRVGYVYVSASDFIADVELAARAVLSPNDYKAFLMSYGVLDGAELPKGQNHRIAYSVGLELLRRRIYPVPRYKSPRLVRQYVR